LKTLGWQTEGIVISTGERSSMTIVFLNGRRATAGERSSLKISAEGPIDVRGTVTPLAAIPPLPEVRPVVFETASTRISAVRVRGDAFERLQPDGEAATVSHETRLEFEPVSRMSIYEIEIVGEDGARLYRTTTKETHVDVPGDVLTPGRRYYWSVEARDALGRVVRGSARFVTLSREQVGRRASLTQALASSPDHLLFLAEIDRSLGLFRQARMGFARISADSTGAGLAAERLGALDALLPRPR
jgi:hypothetical protein